MSVRGIALLGAAARTARQVGLGSAFRTARDLLDAPFVRLGVPPLGTTADGIRLRGFARHRSFLADATRPGDGTYKNLLASLVQPGATVIDGGAHIGMYSLIAARAAGPQGRVIAFEPDPYNLRALRVNVRSSGAANIEIVAKALADRPGRTRFVQSHGTIGSSIVDRSDTGPVSTIEVELTTIDDTLPEPPRSLVVKLNVEGAEPRVLAGMQRTLERCPDISLIVELNPPVLRDAGTDPAALVAQLRGLGFTLWRIDRKDESLHEITAADGLGKGHVLCRREG